MTPATAPKPSPAELADALKDEIIQGHGFSRAEVIEFFWRCVDARNRAYCPYSKFPVGSTVLVAPKPIAPAYFDGVNVENACYPVGTCAERVALGAAAAAGVRPGMVRAVAVVSALERPCSPCGMCRQFIREFCGADVPVFMFGAQGSCDVKTVGELLPAGFGAEDLEEVAAMRRGKVGG